MFTWTKNIFKFTAALFMHKDISFRLLLIFFLILANVAQAQDTLVVPDSVDKEVVDYYEMSLEQLQKLKAVGVSSELEQLINSLISVASKKPLTARESPSIVSLITEEEIRRSGARDLIDVLSLVPGFDFGMDVEGVVGISTRGNWVHEGKMLLLVDGQEMNEPLFGTTQFGNHFPVQQIKKIEIIRGPGSAIYGGYAEYGVINIVTKGGSDMKGITAGVTYGQMVESVARKNVDLYAGGKKGDFEGSIGAFIGQGQRSDKQFTDFYGGTYDMKNNSSLDPMFFNVAASYKDFSARYILDNYSLVSADGYDAVKVPYRQHFISSMAELKYNNVIDNKWTITPRFNYKRQVPWKTPADSLTDEYHRVVERISGNLSFSYNLTRKINIVFGGEMYHDKAQDLADSSTFISGEKSVSYLNSAAFLQSIVKLRLVNIILGARFDNHSEYGSAFVPRVGLTKRFHKFHFKLLYTDAFKAPSIENIDLQDSTGMKPEKTSVAELELGYQIGRNSILTLNLFDIETRSTIAYYFNDSTGMDAYHNIGNAGSRGLELEYKVKNKWGYINLNYAFYSVEGKDKIEDYAVPENNKVLLAFPSHKINLSASYAINKHLSVAPSLLWRGERFGYTGIDSSGTEIVSSFKPSLYANIFITCDNIFTKGLNISAGVYNIFNEAQYFIQPYNSGHAPLPAGSREFVFRLSYTLNFKKGGS
jgi:outer membrane receptor for ferrienterochelin and colicin